MNKILTFQPWKIFLILTSSMILSIFFSVIDLTIFNIDSLKLSILLRIVGLFIYFLWILFLGISLNKRKEGSFKLNKLLFVLAITFCIIGYSKLNIEVICHYSSSNLLDFLIAILTFWGVIYTFYSVSKVYKSVVLERDVNFSECILEAFLIAFFPIGIWFIQPRINIIFSKNDNL